MTTIWRETSLQMLVEGSQENQIFQHNKKQANSQLQVEIR